MIADVGRVTCGFQLRRQIEFLAAEVAEEVRSGRDSGEKAGMFAMNMQVATRRVPERQVLTIAHRVSFEDLVAFNDRAFRALYGHIARSGAKAGAVGYVIFHEVVDAEHNGLIEIAVEFEGEVPEIDDLVARVEAAHEEAFVTLTLAEYEDPGTRPAYDALAAWLARHSTSHGLSRVIFLGSALIAADEDPYCEVAWPFAR